MEEKTIKERWNGKTPKFWKKVQRYAFITGAIAGAIIAAPIALPAGVVTAITYVATISATLVTSAQLTVDNTQKDDTEEGNG